MIFLRDRSRTYSLTDAEQIEQLVLSGDPACHLSWLQKLLLFVTIVTICIAVGSCGNASPAGPTPSTAPSPSPLPELGPIIGKLTGTAPIDANLFRAYSNFWADYGARLSEGLRIRIVFSTNHKGKRFQLGIRRPPSSGESQTVFDFVHRDAFQVPDDGDFRLTLHAADFGVNVTDWRLFVQMNIYSEGTSGTGVRFERIENITNIAGA
jgi:hypothetical protein